MHNATWADAEARCRQYGARLCTRAELPVNKNSGCGHDAELVWVWEQCDHSVAPEYVCAVENGACNCDGVVHYGRRFDPTDGEQINTLAGMAAFETLSTSSAGGTVCSNAIFGDPAPTQA